ncbi:MAG: ATP-binding protein [Mediterranea sp.]|jgi:AAA15 family ATPase/GTPase|nr:ATP-binding protein [Mediterranea sp.]
MLLRVVLENFLSFDEAVQFDMFPNGKRTTFADHIYPQEIPVLKQAAIYGANGSGKSNLIKGVDFIRNTALSKSFLSSIELERYFFKLKKGARKAPIALAVEFSMASAYFIYKIEVSLTHIKKEELYRSGRGKESSLLIFRREDKKVELRNTPSAEVAAATNELIRKNPLSSLLALNREFPIIKDVDVNKVSDWFEHKLDVVSIHSDLINLMELMRKQKALLAFTNNLFRELDLGIAEIGVKSENLDEWIGKHASVDENVRDEIESLGPKEAFVAYREHRQAFSVSIENGMKKVHQFVFNQLGKKGYLEEMDIHSQSDGTVRILILIPALYAAIHQEDKTVLIDEIDNGIHPVLVKNLIRYFATRKAKGQLIFTTHQTGVLDQKQIMRSDEIWFTEKKDGATQLYSLNDFKTHNSLSIEHGYLEGRYGAIPIIGAIQ